jgi:hypothetical protein
LIPNPAPGNIYRGRAQRGKAYTAPESDSARNAGQLIVSCHRPHLLGNPFKIGEDGTRDEVIDLYRKHLRLVFNSRGIGNTPSVGDKIKAKLEHLRQQHLQGVELILLCFCLEGDGCHVDVLIEWIRTGEL